jgi:hypothetical protein
MSPASTAPPSFCQPSYLSTSSLISEVEEIVSYILITKVAKWSASLAVVSIASNGLIIAAK